MAQSPTNLGRRGFLVGAGALGAGAVLAGCTSNDDKSDAAATKPPTSRRRQRQRQAGQGHHHRSNMAPTNRDLLTCSLTMLNSFNCGPRLLAFIFWRSVLPWNVSKNWWAAMR